MKITKETIKSGKYLQNNPKLLLLAACGYNIDKFAKIARNFRGKQTIITMIREWSVTNMDTNNVYANLNQGKYLFKLLNYCHDENLNLCNDTEIKIILHGYYSQYHQIISSYSDDTCAVFDCDSAYSDTYNQHIQLIINHFHASFIELFRLKNQILNKQCGSKIAINYIHFLLSIWDKPNLYQSKKDEMKNFWFKNLSPYDGVFTDWIMIDAISILRMPEEPLQHVQTKHVLRNTMLRDLDSMCLYALLLFKIGDYYSGYSMLYLIHRCKYRYGSYDAVFGRQINVERRNYTYINEYCLQIDKMLRCIETTIWKSQSVPKIINEIHFPISKHSNLARFRGFDKKSLEWLLSLFNMNCRFFESDGFPVLKVSCNTIRQIRTSLFFFAMNFSNDYDRLYWLQFGTLSIGIQSLLWINCDKFKLPTKNGVQFYDYKKLEKYLYRFVIDWIKSALKFPITPNTVLVNVAHLCLLLAYFVVGEFKKVMHLLNSKLDKVKCNDKTSIHYITQLITHAIQVSNRDRTHRYTRNYRAYMFITCMEHMQECEYGKYSKVVDSQTKICHVLNRPAGGGSAKSKRFVKWKNAILKRNRNCCNWNSNKPFLQVCKGCKNSYYCSKKCQKSHWVQHKKHCSHSAC